MRIAAEYLVAKNAVIAATGATEALLHVHAGMLVLFLARIVTRRSLATLTPFLVVLAAAMLNELFDRANHGSWRLWNSTFDVINTIFWPLVLMIGLRVRAIRPYRPCLRGGEEDAPAG
jgi:hypothetical protein